MSDMQWRKRDGTTGTYAGPLVDLGQGIPRQMRAHGFRRAVFDLAFGYVSGFPLRDILAFSVRSLLPQRDIPTLEAVEVEPSTVVGTAWIECPSCGEYLPAVVTAEVVDEAGDGQHAELVCTPDMTDIHAHVWAHDG